MINLYVTTFTTFRPSDGGHWVGDEPNLPTEIEVNRILGSGPRFEKMCKSFFFLRTFNDISITQAFSLDMKTRTALVFVRPCPLGIYA